jgi:RNA polymerase sigma-70 factor (ECF subfamily)
VKEVERTNQAATKAEIVEAINRLTEGDLARLASFARARLYVIQTASCGRNEDDLLQEAFMKTLAGDRKWNKGRYDFKGHLFGAIRSISSAWAEGAKTKKSKELDFEPGIAIVSDADASNSRESEEEAALRKEAALAAEKDAARVREYFKGEPRVLEIIEGLEEGMTGTEICDVLGISRTEYETAMRRLRRNLPKVFPGGIVYAEK